MFKLVGLAVLFGSLLASIPEKVGVLTKQNQGGVYFSSNNEQIRRLQFAPVITYHRLGDPYHIRSFKMLDKNKIGLHFQILDAGEYLIDGFYDFNSDIPMQTQGLTKIHFKVAAGAVNYLGRLNLQVLQDKTFQLKITDRYADDSNQLYLQKGGGFVTSKSLFEVKQ